MPLGLAEGYADLSDKAAALEQERLEKPIMRLVKVDGVPEEAARVLRLEFLRFCVLRHHTKRTISPSAWVDVFWHAFILHTEDYHAFCARHFGSYFHHSPQDHTAPDRPRDPAPGKYTLDTIADMFPSRDESAWAQPAICSHSHCDGPVEPFPGARL